MNNTVSLLNNPCPVCGNTSYTQSQKHTTMYRCATMSNNSQCKYTVYKCKKCEKYYPKAFFGKHGDVWECKECGAVQWDVTDINKMLEMLQGKNKAISAFLK